MAISLFYTNIIKIGNSKGVLIPTNSLGPLGAEVEIEETSNGLFIRKANTLPPLKEWDNIFASLDTGLDKEFEDWDNTIGDGIE